MRHDHKRGLCLVAGAAVLALGSHVAVAAGAGDRAAAPTRAVRPHLTAIDEDKDKDKDKDQPRQEGADEASPEPSDQQDKLGGRDVDREPTRQHGTAEGQGSSEPYVLAPLTGA